MFGFIRTSTDDLSPEENARYESMYCGLCHTIGEEDGQLTRLALSNDMTFLTLLLGSLYEPDEQTCESTCVMHPVKARPCTTHTYSAYAADMTLALAYHKALDDWNDEQKRSAKAYYQMLRNRYEVVRQRWPRQCAALEEGLTRISAIEAELAAEFAHNDDPAATADHLRARADEAARIFGTIHGELYVVDEADFWSEQLRIFGFFVGRFVYMMDAAVDLSQDRENGTYNPFVGFRYTPNELRTLLMDAMGQAADAFERLPLERDLRLMRSVLYAGVWQEFNKVYPPENERTESEA